MRLTLSNKFDELSTGLSSARPGFGGFGDLGGNFGDGGRVSGKGGGLSLQGVGGDRAGGHGGHGVILELPALRERFLARLQSLGDAGEVEEDIVLLTGYSIIIPGGLRDLAALDLLTGNSKLGGGPAGASLVGGGLLAQAVALGGQGLEQLDVCGAGIHKGLVGGGEAGGAGLVDCHLEINM